MVGDRMREDGMGLDGDKAFMLVFVVWIGF